MKIISLNSLSYDRLLHKIETLENKRLELEKEIQKTDKNFNRKADKNTVQYLRLL